MKRSSVLTAVALFLFSILLVGEPVTAVDYTTPIPLPELCGDTYFGQSGCLYPTGNEPPASYQAELDAIASQLSADSQVVVLTLGMSMQQNATNGFMSAGYASGTTPAGTVVNPAFMLLNGAIGSKQQNWVDPNSSVWDRGLQMLSQAGLSANDVDVVFYHNAWAGPSTEPFPQHAITMQNSVGVTLDIIADKYPNTQMILVSNRHYALSATSKHPEPWAYEEAFSWKWVVEDRINCTADCGPPVAWLADQWDQSWSDHPEYYASDGLHLSPGPGGGQYASAEIWYEWMSTISYVAPWYLAEPAPTATASLTPTVVGGTATPTPFPTDTATPVPTDDPTLTPTPTTEIPRWCRENPDWPGCEVYYP